jgi:hypothetical protein
MNLLIHELIHSNCIDKHIIYSKDSHVFSKIFCSNYNVLLNESFTETMACIINMYIIFILNNKVTDYSSFSNEMFKNECTYSNYICSKIKTFYNIDKISNIIKKNVDKEKLCVEYFPQETNVISYYFLKNILLHNINKLDTLMLKYSTNYKITDNKFIIEIIKIVLDDIKRLDKRLININDNNNSLKMSYYELK